MPRPDLTISLISADNLNLLLPCLRSIFDNTHQLTLEVYLVDNASTDDTAEAVRTEFPLVQVIRNETRLGFASNNNLVLEQGQGRYLMLLNDDTLILDGALDTLVAFMDAQPDAGIVGSFLLNPDMSFQAAFSTFPNPWIEGFWSTAAFFPSLKADVTKPFLTDTVCGAALLIRREVMEKIGLLDTRFDPIYAEETDWCFRVKQAGWGVYTHPGAKIIHYGGQTMNRIPETKLELLQRHKALYFRKHHGNLPTLFFKLTLFLVSILKYARHSLPGFKDKQQAQLHRYISGIALKL